MRWGRLRKVREYCRVEASGEEVGRRTDDDRRCYRISHVDAGAS
jgi:hypothetical protein